MELKCKKIIAISLIELLISLVMTAILMLMLFGIVSKKARNGIVHGESVFYCWKDWSGSLYQKLSSESMQNVSECKVKIPKDAKNIQVYLVGAGAGGYSFDKAAIRAVINDEDKGYIQKTEHYECLKPTITGSIFTKMFYDGNVNKNGYDIMTNCTKADDEQCDKEISKGEYVTVKKMFNDTYPNKDYFGSGFYNELYTKGYCYLEVYDNDMLKYAHMQEDDGGLENKLIYYKGSDASGACAGMYKKTLYSVTEEDGVCYQNGFVIRNGTNIELTNNDVLSNEFTFKHLNPTIDFGKFQKSLSGEVVRGYAEAGREYVIPARNIGTGGDVKSEGGTTKFGNLKAKGGGFAASESVLVSVPQPQNDNEKLNSVDKKSIEGKNTKHFSICSSSNIKDNCKGSSDVLKKLPEDKRIIADRSVDIVPDTYKGNSGAKWDESKNFEKSSDDIKKSGFGLFGVSAPAVDCAVKYNPIKKIKYNTYEYEITGNPVIECASSRRGMGGAIIILWN